LSCTKIEQKGSTVSITVSGYAGTYKNFRAMTPQDSTILEIKPAVVNTVYKETTQGYENY